MAAGQDGNLEWEGGVVLIEVAREWSEDDGAGSLRPPLKQSHL
jgi:hypothetical protein